MNRKEAKTRIAALLSAGARKADMLAELTGQGLKDRVLARLIGLGIAQLAISLALAYLNHAP